MPLLSQTMKKSCNDPLRLLPLLRPLLLVKSYPLMDREMDGSQNRRRITVRARWALFERFLPDYFKATEVLSRNVILPSTR
jgi:hypothetical protein